MNSARKFASLSPPVWRASTIVFDSLTDFVQRRSRQPDGYSYGVNGTPTTRKLEDRIALLEGGNWCVAMPSGAAALAAAVLAFVKGGDHMLISAACYGSLQALAETWLNRAGVEVEYFDPATGADIEQLFRPNTRLICLEAPGSITMEMHDTQAIARAAQRHGVLTMMDNTWASPLGFRPLDHGIDLSIEAATKYIGGHSDLLIGTISGKGGAHYSLLRDMQSMLGLHVSPEDCFLALRGLETLRLRHAAQCATTLAIAQWLSRQPQVREILYPPLPGDRGHAIWKRDFHSAGCLFSLILQPAPETAYHALFDTLEVFSIGASWGGVHSLAAYYPAAIQAERPFSRTDQPLIRLSIGLEDKAAIITDLQQALQAYTATVQGTPVSAK